MRDRLRVATLACCAFVACAALSGCATASAERPADPKDPIENVNRAIYKFNDAVDRVTLKPIAKGYKWITPEWFRRGVGNFFSNLQYPATIVNQLLQGKAGAAARDTGRLLMNTVLGLGGVLDPATSVGLDKNDEDLGQTLGVWGVPSGPYFVMPFLGPTTVRDAPSTVAETFLDPLAYSDVPWEVIWGLRAVDIIDSRAQLLSLEPVLERTFDPYAFVRNAFLQRREYQVRDGDVPEEDLEKEFLEDESMDEPVPEPEPETETEPETVSNPE